MCTRTGTLVKLEGDLLQFFKIRCRAWTCSECARLRRKQLIAAAVAGTPNRFITLTVNPNWFDSPEDRAARLSKAWRLIVAAFRHRWPTTKPEYLCVFEETARGEPHLHIMWRGPFMPQKWLSKQMEKRMGAPVVDVRLVRDKKQVAKYIYKYISKRNIKIGKLKRYWSTPGYLPASKKKAKPAIRVPIYYWLTKRHWTDHVTSCLARHISVTCESPSKWSARLPAGMSHPPWLWLQECIGVRLPETQQAA